MNIYEITSKFNYNGYNVTATRIINAKNKNECNKIFNDKHNNEKIVNIKQYRIKY